MTPLTLPPPSPLGPKCAHGCALGQCLAWRQYELLCSVLCRQGKTEEITLAFRSLPAFHLANACCNRPGQDQVTELSDVATPIFNMTVHLQSAQGDRNCKKNISFLSKYVCTPEPGQTINNKKTPTRIGTFWDLPHRLAPVPT